MLSDLNTILSHFPSVSVIRYWGNREPKEYCDVLWMGVFDGTYQKNCIYIGKTSQFSEVIPPKNVSLIVLNDTGCNCAEFGGEVVEVSPETELAELCLQIRGRFFPSYEIPDIAQVLLSGLFSNCGVNEIIDAAFVHLNNPIMVTFSQNHKNLYYSCGEELQYEFNIPESVIRERESAIGYTKMRENVLQELRLLRPVIIDNGDYFKGKRRVLSPITQGAASRKQLGVMAVFEVNRPINDKDLSLIRIISQMLSEKCESPVFRETLLNSSYEQRIQALIQGKQSDANLNWVTNLFGSGPYNFSFAMVDVRAMNVYRIEALQYTFSRTIRTDITLMRGSYLIAITNLAGRDTASYMQKLRDFSANDHIVIACSSRFSDIQKLRKYYAQTKMLLRYALRLGLSSQVCDFSRLRANVLINELAEKSDLDIFVCDDLERLIAFDKANNCEYYRTLTTWLHNGMNREAVREQLHIHRNTLAYRLERIEEILGMKLNEENTLLNLYLSEAIRAQTASTAQGTDES